jgi:hypothetical protein
MVREINYVDFIQTMNLSLFHVTCNDMRVLVGIIVSRNLSATRVNTGMWMPMVRIMYVGMVWSCLRNRYLIAVDYGYSRPVESMPIRTTQTNFIAGGDASRTPAMDGRLRRRMVAPNFSTIA